MRQVLSLLVSFLRTSPHILATALRQARDDGRLLSVYVVYGLFRPYLFHLLSPKIVTKFKIIRIIYHNYCNSIDFPRFVEHDEVLLLDLIKVRFAAFNLLQLLLSMQYSRLC